MSPASALVHSSPFFQGVSSLRRSEGGSRANHLWTSSTPGAGKGLFRPCMHPVPILAPMPPKKQTHSSFPFDLEFTLLELHSSYVFILDIFCLFWSSQICAFSVIVATRTRPVCLLPFRFCCCKLAS